MAWNSYIDSVVSVSGGDCDKVCLIGAGGGVWTDNSHASHLQITADESQKIAQGFQDESEFQANGVRIAGVKYQFLRRDDKVIYAKKKEEGAITMQMSVQAITIGHTAEGKQVGNTNKGVAHVAEYLTSVGY